MNKKKNLLWLLSLLMIVSVSFTSCNKDDDDDDDLKTAIIGKWKSVSNVFYVDGVKDDEESEIADDGYYSVVEFKSDGTYLTNQYEDGKKVKSYTGTWKVEGTKLISKNDVDSDEPENEVTHMSINGNTLISTYEDEYTGADDKKHTLKIVSTLVRQ